MRKTTLFLILIIIILGSGLFYIYENLPKTNTSDKFSNISISANLGNQKIKTGYVIETTNKKIIGNTSQVYELQRVRQNQLIKIYNKNIGKQDYFTDKRVFNVSKDMYRIDLILNKPKPIKITKNNNIIKIYSNDARNLTFCLDWSLNYIYVKPLKDIEFVNLTKNNKTILVKKSIYSKNKYPNYNKTGTSFKQFEFNTITKPKEYSDWKKCYGTFSLKNSTQRITILFKKFGIINKNDYINIVVIRQHSNNEIYKFK